MAKMEEMEVLAPDDAPEDGLDGWIAQGDFERARSALDRSPAAERGALWWRRYAECLMIGGRLPAAEEAALRGLECLRAEGLGGEGEREWQRLTLLRADALRGQGAFTTAEALYLVALRQDPTSAPALSRYALLLVLAGQVERGREILTQAASLHPSHPDVEAARARIHWLCDEALPGDRLNGALILLPHSKVGHTKRLKDAASVGDRGAVSESWARLCASGAGQDALDSLRDDTRAFLHWSSRPWNTFAALLDRGPISHLALLLGSSLMFLLIPISWDLDVVKALGVFVLAFFVLLKVRSKFLTWRGAPLSGMELPEPPQTSLTEGRRIGAPLPSPSPKIG